jgi:hypothetical protein
MRRNPYPFVASFIVSTVEADLLASDEPAHKAVLGQLQKRRREYLEYAKNRLRDVMVDPEKRGTMLTEIIRRRIPEVISMAQKDNAGFVDTPENLELANREYADILAITTGSEARRLGFSEEELANWISNKYGEFWVKPSDLKPGMDLKKVIIRAKKAWKFVGVREPTIKTKITEFAEEKRSDDSLESLIYEIIEQESEDRDIAALDIHKLYEAGQLAYRAAEDSESGEEAARVAIVDLLDRYSSNPRRRA